MLTTDPIADLLTRIRNGLAARHATVDIPASKIKEEMLKILKQEGFIANYVVEKQEVQNTLKVFLKYGEDKKATISNIRRVSKPGGRVYRGYKEIKPFLKGMGLRILSTPQGLLADHKARAKKVGGEVLCEIW